MSKQEQNPFRLPDAFGAIPAATKESFESMSKAFSDWLSNANRMQTEMARFISDRFNKDVTMISRFASCKKPEDFLQLQAELVRDLTNDYLQEGAKIFGLFSDAAKEGFGELRKTTGPGRSS